MLFNISKRYDSTMELIDWINPEDNGTDQYTPILQSRGNITGYVAVDPGSGNMFLEVKELLTGVLGIAIITNVKNARGQQISRPDYGFQAQYPIPQINAYGQIFSYRYNLTERVVGG